MTKFHHHKLPDYRPQRPEGGPNVLIGHSPPAEFGFQSDNLQIIYNFQGDNWVGEGERLHCHTESDECFIVLHGQLTVEVEGKVIEVKTREFCCFPKGVFHAIKQVHPPVEVLVIRGPSVQDKVYKS